MKYEDYIAVTQDFPKKGISFKDISPLLKNPEAFRSCIDDMCKIAEEYKPNLIIGPESRGFLFGSAMAYKMGIGFIMARKAGKLPGKTIRVSYALEYGEATIEIPFDSIKEGDRILIVDDLMATGGTFAAIKKLILDARAVPVACLTLINLEELHGEKLVGLPCRSLLNLSDTH